MKRFLTFAALAVIMLGSLQAQTTDVIGKQNIKLKSRMMTPEALWAMGRIGATAVSPDGQKVVYQVGYYSVKQNKSHQVLYVMNADGTGQQLLTTSAKSDSDPSWLDNETIAFISGGEVWSMKVNGTDRHQLSKTDGKVEGYKFSPDFKQVILIQSIPFNEVIQKNPDDLPKATGRRVTDLMYRHWDHYVESIQHPYLAKSEMRNEKLEIISKDMVDILEGEPYECPMEPFGGIEQLAWSPDSKTIYMFELNREQNDCRLVSYDATTGAKKAELYRETSDKYVEPLHPIQFLPWDSNLFVMQSQRDGYNHLYLYNKKGEMVKQLTKGVWVVMDVLGFNQKDKSIIIASNEKHALQSNLYAVNIKTLKRTLLDNGEGVHWGKLSSSGTKLYEKYSTPTTPNTVNAIEISNFKPRTSNLLTAEDPWKDYVQPIFESGSIKAADGVTDLYWRMVKPHGFDITKKYPTVVYVYGGPHAHNVDASWHWASRSWETYMAQKGYIVFILDNRGSENRGLDFEQATFHQLGQIEMQDQMKGVEYLRTLPYIDMNRLGVHGWSFGGFMTISLITNYPDVFKVGVAGGPVIDWKWYEVMYGERYMGTPQNNPEGYAKTSLINKAKDLKGKLQIITGYNDNTVVPQHCLSFLDACIKAGTQPDFFAYPGEEHNMRGHASVHLHERITQYFEDYLK